MYVCVVVDRALEIESTMVKARQRRAVARMHMARRCEAKGERECEALFAGAVADLECAASFEPASKTIREDLEEAMSCALRATRTTRGPNGGRASRVWRRIHVKFKDSDEDESEDTKESNATSPDQNSSTAVETLPSPVASSSSQTTQPSSSDAPDASSKTKTNSPRTAVEIASTRVRVNMTAPQSSFEFENRWKALDGDNVKRRELLSSLVAYGEKPIRAVFQSSLNADMLFSVLEVLVHMSCDANAEESIDILKGFARVERFDMTILLLGKKRVAALRDAWRDVSASMSPASIAGFNELGKNFKFLV